MAAASIRAGFVTLRAHEQEHELPAELRFAPELQLQLLGAEASGGALEGGSGLLSLRRERTGVYCTAAAGELSFQPEADVAGASSAVLPFRLTLEKSLWAEGELVLSASGASRLTLRPAAGGAPAEDGGVDMELVLLVSSAGPPTALTASVTLAPLLAQPVALPTAFLRTGSGRAPTLEPIDEDVGVRLPAARAALGAFARIP